MSDSEFKINMLHIFKEIKDATKVQGAIPEKINNSDFIKMKKLCC